MLAELAAANAAFAIIKKTIQNTGDLTRCGKAISDLIIAKEELKRKGNKKRRGSIRKGDLEEFIALEKLRQQENDLRSWMQLYGRAGLYRDWQEFQAKARKERRVQEELARRKREEIMEILGLGFVSLLIAAMVGGLVAWIVWLKGGFR